MANADGSFWVSDEYGPYIFKVNAEGCTTTRLTVGAGLPRVARSAASTAASRASPRPTAARRSWPCSRRRSTTPRPLKAAPSRLARILVVEPTGTTRQYAYLLEDKGLGVSDILWMGGSRYLVLERDGKWIGDSTAVKRFYAIDLKDATDLSDPADGATGRLVDGKTLEELTDTPPTPPPRSPPPGSAR
ncbi:MAG: esterase-like activity of phytase family protein [Gemmatimonadetes bacterium]|nr:esterase-like activity of phytase family protein [Gemmatimonadota bacterium]